MKKFISISPHQPPTRFEKGIYENVDNEKLNFDTMTSFPIMPVINGYTVDGEEIEVITVVSDYGNAEENYKTLIEEINALAVKKNLKVTFKKISIPYSQDIDTQLEMFSKLIDCMADEDKLFCDISFGTKVMSQILTMTLNYGYRIKNNVSLGCIVYGGKNFTNNRLEIYDITSLNYMDEIVRVMAENQIANPAERIKEMLK
ncbi:MAG: TM1812 family CRISPR-associated protein [Ruminococcus sp.]|nr:TM1812 family CRISPR-associated protein [Ruminococcus sp.]MDE6784696.1 TM1812 family CRISPR-associated protein [Ruminococcus sp.]